MPPKNNPFSRKTATTYALVNRPQNDPRIHDTEAPSQVFTEIAARNTGSSKSGKSKVKNRGDLEEEFGLSFRKNEGEAAEQGVFFDDSSYDYMQHMRDLGSGGGDVAWVEAPQAKGKGKGKQRLEDMLAAASLDEGDDMASQSAYTASNAPSRSAYGSTYGAPQRSVVEQQQDVPDALKGFQPDMDPRLREVLEALDDEAYVDDEDDVFGELAGGEEMDQYDWEEQGLAIDDDEGWESDDTEKPTREYAEPVATDLQSQLDDSDVDREGGVSLPDPHAAPPDAENPLPDTSAAPKPARAPPTASIAPSAASQLPGPHKKRKGALTSLTGGSMTSSVLARSEALSTLDSRFDHVLDCYMDDLPEESEFGDDASLASGMTGMTGASRASAWTTAPDGTPMPRLTENKALDSAMDEFLSAGGGGKGRKMRKGGAAGTWEKGRGMAQLDEIRQGLGPARMKGGSRSVKT